MNNASQAGDAGISESRDNQPQAADRNSFNASDRERLLSDLDPVEDDLELQGDLTGRLDEYISLKEKAVQPAKRFDELLNDNLNAVKTRHVHRSAESILDRDAKIAKDEDVSTKEQTEFEVQDDLGDRRNRGNTGNTKDDGDARDDAAELGSDGGSKLLMVIGIVITFSILIGIIFYIKGKVGKPEESISGAQPSTSIETVQPTTQASTTSVPTTVSVDRGTLLANTSVKYVDTVYQDRMLVNKFIELRGGVALLKFRGTPEHFGKEIEFIVNADDYNRFVNGVSVVIQYRILSIQDVDYVIDVQLGPQA